MQAYIGRIDTLSSGSWHGRQGIAVFFAGCDFNCPNCNTLDLLSPKEEFLMELKDVKNEIRKHAGVAEAVVFTGGEPCLQRQALISIASFAKDINLKTGIETNGSKTECIRSLLTLGIIDFVAIDIKSPFDDDLFEKATRSRTFFKQTSELMADVDRTLRLLQRYQEKVQIEVRTTITPTLVSRKEDVLKIAEQIQDIDCTWVLQRFIPNGTGRRFSDIKPPSAGFLQNLRESVHKRYPNIRVIAE